MALQLINVGTTSNDGTGDTLRTAGQKMNANASELFGLVADTQGALGEKLEADALAPFETSTQLDDRDTANRTRENHTGTQPAATIADFAAAAAAEAPVQSVAGKTGLVSLAKADVGLGQVDNTADLSKPISTATEAALTAFTTSDTAQDSAIAGLILSDTEQDNAIATFETTTQLDARDTANRARENHTGTQGQLTVTNLETDLAAKAPLIVTQGTIAYGATVNLNMATLAGTHQTIALAGNLALTSSNRGNGRQVVLRLLADATLRTLTFPAGWLFPESTKPANIAASKVGILSLTFFDANDADCVAAWVILA